MKWNSCVKLKGYPRRNAISVPFQPCDLTNPQATPISAKMRMIQHVLRDLELDQRSLNLFEFDQVEMPIFCELEVVPGSAKNQTTIPAKCSRRPLFSHVPMTRPL